MSGSEHTVGSVDEALANLQEMERGEEHSHDLQLGHVDKQIVHAGTDHVSRSGDGVIRKEIVWTCSKCGETIKRIDIRNNG
ncbi:hypothetical protein [Haloglomus salinum]|uniref:hypothetical protein n=1 Tax=Haloglomus salinum TaxID=2962673 RepID=UPI0020C9B214|nr:hypothetical protein [Haloglomus salinum]